MSTATMPRIPPISTSRFHLLAKPTGAVCNLDCTYCFFLSKEMLYPGSRFRMAGQLLETYVQMFDAALASWVGAPAAICIFVETCGGALALGHNGDVYSCDDFVEPQYLLGHIEQVHVLELVNAERQRQFGLAKRDTLPRYCRQWPVLFACHGECPKDRFVSTPGGEPGLNYLCAGSRAFVAHIDRPMRLMADLLQRGQAPAQVMQILAADAAQARLLEAFAAAGRNDPCPCGSGRTFKRCHGRAAPTS
jgi:uncharacterized protein